MGQTTLLQESSTFVLPHESSTQRIFLTWDTGELVRYFLLRAYYADRNHIIRRTKVAENDAKSVCFLTISAGVLVVWFMFRYRF